eukprot:CAMPEP_0174832408 /NCGR_PEP_ID=MMETSP1114-20130205/3662_1 /TAXON_ID=312471 /ORGANISM="Neobodo designis, Strain CCAP 1951/1" /LENGTH=453 /DNA_ID=CAMNT_0016066267 /DNA_START=42 /DNA_END=1403 /DNA_ORIENTATION=+
MAAVADVIAKVHAGEAPTAEEYAALHAAVDSAETPVVARVKAVPLLAQYIEANQDYVTKVPASLVKMLEDANPIVHTAVVKGFADLCVAAAKFLDAAKIVDVIRDVSDVLLQISLPSSGFDNDVRKIAKEAVSVTLPGVSPLGVAIKCIHLLSNDRWNDEAKQLELERKGALDLLQLVCGPKHAAKWTEDDLSKLLKFVSHAFSVVAAFEMSRMIGAIAQIPAVQEKKGAPLVDAVLKLKMDGPRGLESVSKLRVALPKDAENDAIIDKIAPLLTKAKAADPVATQVARTFAFAARYASAEKAEKHIGTVRAALKKNSGDSWTFTEALYLALATLGQKAPEAFAPLLEDDEFRAAVHATATEASAAEPKVAFAGQKAAIANEPTHKYSDAVECLKNVVRVGAFIEVKKVPEAGVPSWEMRKSVIRAPAGKKRVNLDAPIAQAKKPQPKAEGKK